MLNQKSPPHKQDWINSLGKFSKAHTIEVLQEVPFFFYHRLTQKLIFMQFCTSASMQPLYVRTYEYIYELVYLVLYHICSCAHIVAHCQRHLLNVGTHIIHFPYLDFQYNLLCMLNPCKSLCILLNGAVYSIITTWSFSSVQATKTSGENSPQ